MRKTANEFLGLMAEAGRQTGGKVFVQHGEIDSYDKDAGTVIVELKPDGVKTGDIQLGSAWNGMQGGPLKGDQVMVWALDPEFEDLIGFGFTHTDDSPGTPGGEFWIVGRPDKANRVKIKNDGVTEVGGSTAVRAVAPTVELSDMLDALGADDAIVRKADLQVIVNALTSLTSYIAVHLHGNGNFGAPTTNPLTPPPSAPATATASSVAKAKG